MSMASLVLSFATSFFVRVALAGVLFSVPACSGGRETSGDASCAAPTSDDPHNCGACGHDCVGGTCSAGTCSAVEVTSFPLGASGTRLGGPMIAVSADDVLAATGEAQGSLRLVPIDGSGGGLLPGFETAIGATCPVFDGGEWFFDEQGQGLEGLVEEVPVGATVVTSSHAIEAQASVVYTTDASDIYWSTFDIASSQPVVVRSARDSASDAVTIGTLDGTDPAIALGANTSTIFAVAQHGLFAVAKSASSPATVATAGLTASGYALSPHLVAADDDTVYWVSDTSGSFDGTTAVRSAPVAGGTPVVIGTSSVSTPIVELAADTNHVYWVARGEQASQIVAYDKAAATTTTLITSPSPITDMVVAGGALWWATDDGSSGTVHRLAL